MNPLSLHIKHNDNENILLNKFVDAHLKLINSIRKENIV